MLQPEPDERHGASTRQALIRRWSRPIAVGIAVVGLLIVVAVPLAWADRTPGWAYDFHAYFDAGVRLREAGSPYLAETLAGPFDLSPGGRDRPPPHVLYLYPPPLAILFTAVAPLGVQLAAYGWLALNIGLLALTCAVLPVSRPIRLVVFGVTAVSAPLLYGLDVGNVSVLVTFAAALAWRWLDRPTAGISIAAAIAVRPTMAIVVGWWIVRGKWRPALWTVVTVLAGFVASLLFVPLRVWHEYAQVLGNLRGVTGALRNADPGSAVLLFGGPVWLAPVALLIGYAIAVIAILLSLRRDSELSFIVTVSATLVLAPLLWDHYLTLLLLPAAFLASRGRYWGLGLPLLGWLPLPFLSVVAAAGMLLPFLAPPPKAEDATNRMA